MTPLLNRLLRGMVLGLMLLLAATANLVSFSYDADDDDDTPPVNVELNIVAPTKKHAQLIRHYSSAQISQVRKDEAPLIEIASAEFEPALLLDKSSPQLVIPLRR